MTPSDEVDVQVENRLSRIGTDVEHSAVSVFDATLARNLRGREMAAADQLGFFRGGFFQSANVFLGNHEHMRGPLRIDVLKSKGVIVFVNLLGGNLAAHDAAKQAVSHGENLKLPQDFTGRE